VNRLRALLADHVGGLPSRFWWIWAGVFVSALATFVFLFLSVYLTARGFDPWQVGLVVSGFGLGTLAAGPVGGTLADRLGRRPTLLAALVASAACAACLGLVRAPALVVPGVFAFGLASSAVFPPLFSAVADVVPDPLRPRAYALLYWANNVGISLSAIVGGLVGERSWVALFFADAATTLLCAAVVWRRVPESAGPTRPAPASAAETSPAPGRGWRTVLSDRPFVAFVAVFLVFLAVFFQFQMALPISMKRAGFATRKIGRVMAVNGFLIGTLSPFAARTFGGRDRGQVLALGAALVGVGYGAYALCGPAWQWALATAVWSLGEIATMPVAAALVADLAPPDLRGRYNGLYALAFGAGQTLAPLAGGTVLAAAGRGALFVGCLAACLLVAAGHLALGAGRRARAGSGAISRH
jgi:predicted MFS family arabinose efflux permease